MNSLIYKYIFCYLLFISINVWAPIGFAQGTQAADYQTVKAGNFSPGKLEEHYLKHGYQFGQITQEQYLHGARMLLDAQPGGDILEKIKSNGDIEHFRQSTGEFAVMTKRGRIRTYYKTDYFYWIRH